MDLLQHITLKTAGIGGNLTHDYLNGKNELLPFYHYSPDMEGIRNALDKRQGFVTHRQLLYDELHRQYGNSIRSNQLKENIQLLLQENTYTVTTGHQLNLFTGPLYFIYKIASIISLTKKMSEEIPGYHFIPVYWMNSEDHDFAEINHFYLQGEKYEWKEERSKFGPVGQMNLEGLGNLLSKLESFPSQDETFRFIINTYRESSSLSEAHREIVNRLFGEYGVIVLDQDSEQFKKAFAEHISNEIFHKTSIPHLEKTNLEMEKLGYKPQVFAREINFFYTGKGYRERIVEAPEGYALADGSYAWSGKQLEEELKANPRFFSPNVVTRPMFQEFLLPNIVYVGGPAEIAYWLQYKSNFDAQHIFYPVLILRDSFLLLPEKKVRKAKELKLRLEDFFQREDTLVNQYVKDHLASEIDVQPFLDQLTRGYNQLLDEVIKVDPSMDSMVKASQQKTLNDVDKIIQRLNKALKTRHENQLNVITGLHKTIYPGGELQERINNLFDHTGDSHAFIQEIIRHADPFDPRLKVLTN